MYFRSVESSPSTVPLTSMKVGSIRSRLSVSVEHPVRASVNSSVRITFLSRSVRLRRRHLRSAEGWYLMMALMTTSRIDTPVSTVRVAFEHLEAGPTVGDVVVRRELVGAIRVEIDAVDPNVRCVRVVRVADHDKLDTGNLSLARRPRSVERLDT